MCGLISELVSEGDGESASEIKIEIERKKMEATGVVCVSERHREWVDGSHVTEELITFVLICR